ncbi:MAG: phenylacetic acid degradation operon negative regulatory protein PaaX [SAR324 cluster bacterium]|nr:phenylacetic acid degradation operon negative regulatory protein PaaX [SAR324 cluster bacterium]
MDNSFREIIHSLLAWRNINVRTLVVTIFGDLIVPHGGNIWIGSLIKLVQSFEINERLLRTTVFRLTEENWLSAYRIGRKSYYQLTEEGRDRFQEGEERIYFTSEEQWNSNWIIIFLHELQAGKKELFRKQLSWVGFTRMGKNLLFYPGNNTRIVHHLASNCGVLDKVLVINGQAEDFTSFKVLRQLVKSHWDLAPLAEYYQNFLKVYRPVWHFLENADRLDPEACLLIRILLINDYRWIVLNDPHLPLDLLPVDWPRSTARKLCSNIYKKVAEPAEARISSIFETANGPVPEASESYFKRFGELR